METVRSASRYERTKTLGSYTGPHTRSSTHMCAALGTPRKDHADRLRKKWVDGEKKRRPSQVSEDRLPDMRASVQVVPEFLMRFLKA